MKETEVKFLDVDVEAILKMLQEKGTLVRARTLFTEKAYDFVDRSIRDDEHHALCRMRNEGDAVRLTYKFGRTNDGAISTNEELEIEVSDFETTEQILGKLGLTPYRYREKYRTTYALGDALIEIDEYPQMAPYIEIEGTKDAITAASEILGLSLDAGTHKTASEVIRAKGLDPYSLTF